MRLPESWRRFLLPHQAEGYARNARTQSAIHDSHEAVGRAIDEVHEGLNRSQLRDSYERIGRRLDGQD